MQLADFLEHHFLGNSVGVWLGAVFAFLLTLTALSLLRRRVLRLQGSSRPAGRLELVLRLIAGTTRLLPWVSALYFAERLLTLPSWLEQATNLLVLVGVGVQVGLWCLIVLDYLIERQRKVRSSDTAFASSVSIIRLIASAFIWTLVLLLTLDNLGVDVTALIAGLGIGGVAVALAVQTLLKDLLASLTITLDRPFEIGDNISLGKIAGKVEHIGVKSTRLRSTDGELIVLSNSDVLQARIRNFGRMDERRGVIVFAVSYDTPARKVRRVNSLVEEILRGEQNTRLERCHFKEFGLHGLAFEAVFFILDGQMEALLSTQQKINLELARALNKEGISLSYPTQRLAPIAARLI